MRLCISIFHTKCKILYIKLFMCNIMFCCKCNLIESRKSCRLAYENNRVHGFLRSRSAPRNDRRSDRAIIVHLSFLSKEPVGNVSLSISHATWFPGQMHLFGHLKPGLTFPGCHNVLPNDAWWIRSYGRFIKINKEFSETHLRENHLCYLLKLLRAWSARRLSARSLDRSSRSSRSIRSTRARGWIEWSSNWFLLKRRNIYILQSIKIILMIDRAYKKQLN